MDIFIEKMVKKNKTIGERIFVAGIMTLGIILALFFFLIAGSFGLLLAVGAIFGAYYLATSKNIEFEYIYTNGELDIDRIIAQKRRKRMFSTSCKNFDIVAKKDSDMYTEEIKAIKNKIILVSSMNSPDVYFATLNHKGQKTLLLFEPDGRMLSGFKTFIPRKVFI